MTNVIPPPTTCRIDDVPFRPPEFTVADHNAGLGGYGYWGPCIGQTAAGQAVFLVDLLGEDEDGPTYAAWTYVPETLPR